MVSLCSFAFGIFFLVASCSSETTIAVGYPYTEIVGWGLAYNGPHLSLRKCWELCCEYTSCDAWQSGEDACFAMRSSSNNQTVFQSSSNYYYTGLRGNCSAAYYEYPEVYLIQNWTTFTAYKNVSSSSSTSCLDTCIQDNMCTFWEYAPSSSRCLLFNLDVSTNYWDNFTSSTENTIGFMDITRGDSGSSSIAIVKYYQSFAVGGSAAIAFAILTCAVYIFLERKPLSDKSEDLEMMVQKSIFKAVDAKWEVPYPDIAIVKELGTGAFGVVYKAVWRNSDVAVKQLNINASDSTAIKEFLKEANTVKNLRRHNNICGILGVCTNPAYPICILMEFVEGGTLENLIMEGTTPMTALLVIQFAKDICSGMSHIHQESILHCDLAARNLLVDKNGNRPTIKVTDFGLARNSKTDVYQAKADAKFPIRWSAPEVLMKREISRAADVWSFAVVLWEILEARVPFYHLNNDEVAQHVCIQKQHLPKPKRFEYPGEIWEIMKQCWCMDPQDRPSFDTLYGYFDNLESNIAITDDTDNSNSTVTRDYGTTRDSRYEDMTIPEELLSKATAYMSVRESAFVSNDEPLPPTT